ncbi:MAG: hypothetical protein WD157_00600 [Patescibacteria group bacterium]
MSRTIRNTFFTIVALILTTIGLGWNKDIAKENDPVTISQAVLASQTDASSTKEQPFPLKIEFSRQVVRLGQTQVVTINTLANAQLDIVTQYPNGSINNSQTLKAKADSNGQFIQKYKLDDFHFLGVFHVSVVATTKNRTSTDLEKFVLQTWISDQSELINEVTEYKYPLVP